MNENDMKGYLNELKEFAEWTGPSDNQKWVQLYPYGSWSHPFFSDTTIDRNVAEKLVKNFNEKVMGRDLVIEYDHGLDKAKGGKAAGKVIKQEARDNGLWGLVEFNDIAKQEIDNGEWNFISNSHYDTWTNPQTNETTEFVPENPSLTNRPYVRGMVPLNYSEIVIEAKEFSVWSTAYVNNLPDSCFLWIESGGQKDSEGKTVPRSLRHLPYKDSTGKVDLPHLRNAIARIPQMTGGDKAALQAKARNILAKQHSDALITDEELTEELAVIDELVEPAIDDKGGETVDEFEKQLRDKLGLDENADVLAYVGEMSDELGPLRELKNEHSQQKQFSEMYPDQAARLEALEKQHNENFAKSFSDTFLTARVKRTEGEGDEVKTVDTGLGFSALVLEKIQGHAKEFSEGKANFDGFKDVLDTILDNGIVDYGTKGSSREVDDDDPAKVDKPTSSTMARKMFSDKITEIMTEDNITDYDRAYALAATKHPELFEAYKTMKPMVKAE